MLLEQYLPIVEGAIDGALKIKQPNEETGEELKGIFTGNVVTKVDSDSHFLLPM